MCMYSNALQTNFIMDANSMNPDQPRRLLLKEQSDLGPYCLQFGHQITYYISRKEGR